jgi:hypothetical protein
MFDDGLVSQLKIIDPGIQMAWTSASVELVRADHDIKISHAGHRDFQFPNKDTFYKIL